jgi:hypothetical protein
MEASGSWGSKKLELIRCVFIFMLNLVMGVCVMCGLVVCAHY